MLLLAVFVSAYFLPDIGGLNKVEAAGIQPADQLSGADNHTLALDLDGTVYSWGGNGSGQLGNGSQVSQNSFSSGNKVKTSSGTLLSGIVAVSTAGDPIGSLGSHSVALKNDGTVWAWGNNIKGQLGSGSIGVNSLYARQTIGIANVKAISAGVGYTTALKTDNTVWIWGMGSNTPVPVSGLSSVSAISGGANVPSVLKSDGTVCILYGASPNFPCIQVNGLNNIIAISAGQNFTVALKVDGTVWAWGDNYLGQLGDGTYTDRSTPVQVTGLTNVTSISTGRAAEHVLALKSDGTVWSWGNNQDLQLGINSTSTKKSIPTQVVLSTGGALQGIKSISAGNSYSMAIKAEGTVVSWGNNNSNQLGLLGTGNVKYPTAMGLTLAGADNSPPNIILNPSTFASTNQNVVITVSATDNVSGVAQTKWASGNQSIDYFTSGGTELTGTTITATENGTYTVYSKDNLGNEGIQIIRITNIDRIPPINATFIANVSDWTTGNVTVTVGYPADSNVKQYSTDNSNWLAYTAPIVVTANKTIYARSQDLAGNWSAVNQYSVTNIDKSVPSISITRSTVFPENIDGTVTVNATSGSGIAKIKWALGNQTAAYFATDGILFSGSSLNVSEDQVYTIYSQNNVGLESTSSFYVTARPSTKVTNNQLTATWSPVTDSVGYDIEIDGNVFDAGQSLYYSQNALLANSKHTIRLRARFINLPAIWSDLSTVFTKQDLPVAPANLAIVTSATRYYSS